LGIVGWDLGRRTGGERLGRVEWSSRSLRFPGTGGDGARASYALEAVGVNPDSDMLARLGR